VVTRNITLDGSIEMIGDWFDPQLLESRASGSRISLQR
jgi:hypothetical protein